jgi:uncharacterized protein YjdB
MKVDHTWVLAYPAAVTDFGTTLEAKYSAAMLLNDAPNAAVYKGLIDTLELQLLTEQYTVKDAVELNFKIQEAIQNSQNNIKVRYLRGSSLVTDLQIAARGIANLTTYSYSKVDCTRSTVTGDILLDLTFNFTPPVNVNAMTLSNSTLSLPIGTSGKLVGTISPSNASNKTILWTTSNPNVATVTDGIVKAVGGGQATIYAKVNAKKDDGTNVVLTSTCEITVIQGVTSIAFEKTSITLNKDDEYTLGANVSPINATNQNIIWKSSDPTVATVSVTGVVKAINYGSAAIYATSEQDNTKFAKCTVLIPVPASGITIKASSNFVKMGTTMPLTATILPSSATVKTVTWSSDNETIAKVNAKTGVVIPMSPGSFKITATSTVDINTKVTRDFEVIYGITSISLSKSTATLKVGDPDIILTANVNPTYATYKDVTWNSSNTGVATITNVDGAWKVRAIAPGTAIITATNIKDHTKIGRCTVTVPVLVKGLTIKSSADVVKIGSTLSLTAVVAPSDAAVKTVIWSSSNDSIARVSQTGLVIPVAPGNLGEKVIIKAVTTDGNFEATKALEVIHGIKSIAFNSPIVYIKPSDTPVKLNPIFTPTYATDKELDWKSSNPAVATIDQSGNVTAETYGTTIITATSKQDPTKIAKCTVVVPVPVDGVIVNSSTDIVKIGSKLTLTATITPSRAPVKTVSWSSDNEMIATVSSTGVVTPVGPGTVKITATSTANNDIKNTKSLKVVYPVTSISLDKTSIILDKNNEFTLTPTVQTADTNTDVTWKSSNPTVATVSTAGVVKAMNFGNAVIYATSVLDNTKVAKCTVTVPVHVTGITIKSSSATVNMGKPLALAATIAPVDATNKTVKWESSNTWIAKVSTSGVVTPVSPGKVTITATANDGSFIDTIELDVVYAITSVTLNKTTLILDKNDQFTLVANVNPSGATNKEVTWESSNPDIATVDADGNVVAKDVGTAVITATTKQIPAKIARCTVTVPVHVTGITISKIMAAMKVRSYLSLGYIIEPTTATNKTVTWLSSDTSIARVSTAGKVSALKEGTVIITVTSNDGSFTSECTITITNQ